jgi:iron complex outermembrane receptor protein
VIRRQGERHSDAGAGSLCVRTIWIIAFGYLLLFSNTADCGNQAGASPSPTPVATIKLPPIVITATRFETSIQEATADVSVLTAPQIQNAAAETLDDLLRETPGFNTFRRSSSIVTAPADDPEAQGVTLRGIGPGGASRALVLLDGIPINDGFGGWIYWDEVPLDSLQRIEIVNGGGSNLWGNGAEGGVINLITRRPSGNNATARASYGNRDTTDDALTGNYEDGSLTIGLEGNIFNTAGWNIVAPGYRGPIDHNSSSIHQFFSGRIDDDLTDSLGLFLRGSYYHENRDLGTPLRASDAARGLINAGGYFNAPPGRFDLSIYAHLSDYSERFSIVNRSRTSEIPSQLQHVPSLDTGASLTWTRPILTHNRLVAGGDYRLIDGESDDQYFNPDGTAVIDRKVSSGRQNFFGLFIEDMFRPIENLEFDLSVRGDFFQNLHGRIREMSTADGLTVTHFPDRMRTATSPKLGFRYAPTDWLTLRGGLYEAFRAPTLAELYRQSSVEDLVLKPNPNLSPEFLQGGEAGVELSRILPNVILDLTGYWDILHKPISDVVTAINPITEADAERTRENLGRARIRGYEVKLAYDLPVKDWGLWSRHHPDLHLAAQYLRSEAKLLYNPSDPTLEGRRLALVPWDTGDGSLTYRDDLVGELTVELAYQGMQWEDSDNHDLQRGYWIANLVLYRSLPKPGFIHIAGDASAYLKIQNLLNNAYVIDRGGGVPKLGTPFLLLGGLRVGLQP